MKASDFAGIVPDCCTEVLDAMYFTTVLEATPEETISPPSPGDFAFMLQFRGEVSGSFGLQLSGSTACSLAANFLGEDEGELPVNEVAEVVGELANMLCGSVMSRVETARKFVLSHPEPGALPANLATADLLVSRLDTDSGVITAWVVVEEAVCRS
jgi:CheY-specific phosphatase CheX